MDYKKEIYEILLKHKGKGNEISSAKIAKLIGINEDDTHAKTRKYIEDTMEQYKIPLGSNTKGYFIIETAEECDKYLNNLEVRQKGIEKRKNNVKNFFQNGVK